MTRFHDGRDWFFSRRFGLFVHWGLYAIEGFHEQDQWRRRIPRARYVELAKRWNPTAFDPHRWLDLAEEAGMSYAVLTTKHHDGFCLWDTRETAFNAVHTPHGQDLVRRFADACHARGFPVGLYYSVVDWNHPNYPNQGRHHELAGPEAGDEPDLQRYMGFLRRQVRELCTNYGEINLFWWDMNVTQHRDPSINQMIRELQPSCVINNRGMDEGDYGTPEREWDRNGHLLAYETPVEACTSVGIQSWGYRKDEAYYTDRHLQRSIATYLARGGNFLLNVGPGPDGAIPAKPAAILRGVGSWFRPMREALCDVVPASGLTENRDVLLTRRGNTLYVHLVVDPVGEDVVLKPLRDLPRRATLLNDGRELRVANDMLPSHHMEQRGYLRVRGVPVNDYANRVIVLKLEFDRLADAAAAHAAGGIDPNVM